MQPDGSANQLQLGLRVLLSTLKMEATCSSETIVNCYHTTERDISPDSLQDWFSAPRISVPIRIGATRYGLSSPRIESRWGGEIFRTHPDRHWGPPSLLYNGYLVFPRGKATEAWR